MKLEHRYALEVEWLGNRGTGTSGYRDYGRQTIVRSEGKAPIEGSSDKPFHGNADRWNPEEFLLAGLAQCHLLSYLHVAVLRGVVVTDYVDGATGTMTQTPDGGGHFTEVTLRPVVTVASADMVEAALDAHKEASEKCFIANSVNFPVRHEPTIQVAAV
ncbi:MAG TPA: OsmC family protein [Terrimesophilobacter sp.]|nr:OsmC family protein [Terrimesophilobacter sp.]HRQ01045.1 OsmC family protein [Terrimesophilobacter sp.]